MHFEEYTSVDEMMEAMSAAEQAAIDAATTQQWRIGPGDCWMRPFERGLFVFGRVQRPWELVRSELLGVTLHGYDKDALLAGKKEAKRIIAAATDQHWFQRLVSFPGSDPFEVAKQFGRALTLMDGEARSAVVEEFAHTLASTQESWRRGNRFGRAFSTVVPAGEYGSTHISQMIPLRLKEFVDAQAAGWNFSAMAHPKSPQMVRWARDMVLSGEPLASLYRREVR